MSFSPPKAPPSYSQADQSDLRASILQADRENQKQGADIDGRNARYFIYSPNGQRWRIMVSNSGSLSAVSA